MPKHKHADLIKAWADGAEIEYLSLLEPVWVSTSTPSWYETTEYRIKPEPKPDRVHLQNHYEHDGQGAVWLTDTPNSTPSQLVQWIIDGETGRIKSVELLDK